MNLALVVVVGCTVGMTIMTIRREFFPPQRLPAGVTEPQLLQRWDTLAARGHRLGPEEADVTIITFSDFECPVCRNFALNIYPEFRDRYPGRTALVYRHWPLDMHRFAYPAARASECAAAQGAFWAYHDLLYDEQAQLGLKTFRAFARDAGVEDLDAFQDCYDRNQRLASVEADVATVKALGGSGTPTVIVNGWLLVGGVSAHRLDSVASAYLR